MKIIVILALTMIPILLASHYAYGASPLQSNAMKLNKIVRDMDDKITTFDSTPRMKKSDVVAAIKQYKNDIIKIKQAYQVNAERGNENFLAVLTFKKALRAAELAADNAYCLVANKYLNSKAYSDCTEKFMKNKNKALRLTLKLV